jgi:glycerophosphodiester phosphodiesterase
LASEPLVMAPRLIGKIKSHNIVCVSYGNLNDDPQNSKVGSFVFARLVLFRSLSRFGSCLSRIQGYI